MMRYFHAVPGIAVTVSWRSCGRNPLTGLTVSALSVPPERHTPQVQNQQLREEGNNVM